MWKPLCRRQKLSPSTMTNFHRCGKRAPSHNHSSWDSETPHGELHGDFRPNAQDPDLNVVGLRKVDESSQHRSHRDGAARFRTRLLWPETTGAYWPQFPGG